MPTREDDTDESDTPQRPVRKRLRAGEGPPPHRVNGFHAPPTQTVTEDSDDDVVPAQSKDDDKEDGEDDEEGEGEEEEEGEEEGEDEDDDTAVKDEPTNDFFRRQPAEEEDDDDLEPETLVAGNDFTDEEIRDGDPRKQKHATGAIVRVHLLNFVTYTDVEFNPAPSLNMIIGPNGTGKSTLVCAICLGLGWAPNHLGRAKEIHEFVKHGSTEASIEIELQGKGGKQNPVIMRKIFKESNSTKYFLNGRPATHKAVQQLVHSFSIQIDNLCQFLPQDRVAEFAGLDSISLLRETQRAAAPPKVLAMHEALISIGKDKAGLVEKTTREKDHLSRLEARQRVLEPEVARMRERGDVEREIGLHKKAKPFARYRITREENRKAKQAYRTAQDELKRLEASVAPSQERVREKKDYRQMLGQEHTKIKSAMDEKERAIRIFKRDKLEQANKAVDSIREEVNEYLTKERSRKVSTVTTFLL